MATKIATVHVEPHRVVLMDEAGMPLLQFYRGMRATYYAARIKEYCKINGYTLDTKFLENPSKPS